MYTHLLPRYTLTNVYVLEGYLPDSDDRYASPLGLELTGDRSFEQHRQARKLYHLHGPLCFTAGQNAARGRQLFADRQQRAARHFRDASFRCYVRGARRCFQGCMMLFLFYFGLHHERTCLAARLGSIYSVTIIVDPTTSGQARRLSPYDGLCGPQSDGITRMRGI